MESYKSRINKIETINKVYSKEFSLINLSILTCKGKKTSNPPYLGIISLTSIWANKNKIRF